MTMGKKIKLLTQTVNMKFCKCVQKTHLIPNQSLTLCIFIINLQGVLEKVTALLKSNISYDGYLMGGHCRCALASL